MMKNPVSEALRLTNEAKALLEEAQSCLAGARGWGLFDLLGGNGLITGMLKHSKINRADTAMQCAVHRLNEVQRLLTGASADTHIPQAPLGGLLRFMDTMSNSLLAGLVVQQKISDRREQVRQLMDCTQQLRQQLMALGQLES